MKKHLVEILSSDNPYRAESLVTEKEDEGWELITPIQIIQPRQLGPHYSESGKIILTFKKEEEN